MPRAEAMALLARVGHEKRTSRTLDDPASVAADLDRIAERCYALDDEEDNEGIICVAAAIFGREGNAVGAISVTTLKQLLPQDAVPPVARTLLRNADRISNALGGMAATLAWTRLNDRKKAIS